MAAPGTPEPGPKEASRPAQREAEIAGPAFFTADTLAFLRDLAANNEKPWFEANKQRYLERVREPAQRFILAVGERLAEVSPQLIADPRPVGGSLFRIHRDLRFSRDKRPYKTAIGIQFRHSAGKDAHAPGLYVHVDPAGSFVGMGTWRPAGPALRAIREAIVDDPDAWAGAVGSRRFKKRLELGGESLTRPPRGFDPEHPLVEDLKRKDFIASAPITDDAVTGPKLVDTVLESGKAGRDFLGFLCRALAVPF